MILTCPECATGYFVEDGQIRAEGRSVRCAACGYRWTARPESPLDLVSSSEEGAVGRGAALAEPPLTGDDLPKQFRARATNQLKLRQAAMAGLVWGAVVVVLALLVGAAIIFREGVVHAWPSTASTYAAIGLPVNRVGLVIENVRADPALQEGHAALSVSMAILNIEDHAIVSPPLSIVLLDAKGKRVGGQIVRPANPRIPPGERRFFATAILDPPLSAHDLEVTFAVDAAGKLPTSKPVRAPAPAPAAAPVLRGPTETALPLPPASAPPGAPTPTAPAATPSAAAPPAAAPPAIPAAKAAPHG
jgi:predicted Zn finger-like uncharacterized protein